LLSASPFKPNKSSAPAYGKKSIHAPSAKATTGFDAQEGEEAIEGGDTDYEISKHHYTAYAAPTSDTNYS
jgi:hypothetical protein